MIGILAKELISFQLCHIVVTPLTVDINVQFVRIEACATSAEFALLGRSRIFIEGWHLSEREYA